MARQKLITKAIQKLMPALGTTDGLPASERKVPLKIFNPTGSGTWYVLEANFETGEAFGYVDLHEREFGYFDLNELAAIRGRMGLPLERDAWWDPNTTLDQVISGDRR